MRIEEILVVLANWQQNKPLQYSTILVSNHVDFGNAVVGSVSFLPRIFNSSKFILCQDLDIFLASYSFSFSLFIFTQWSAWRVAFTIWQVVFSLFTMTRSGSWLGLGFPFAFQRPILFYLFYSPEKLLDCASKISLHCQTENVYFTGIYVK